MAQCKIPNSDVSFSYDIPGNHLFCGISNSGKTTYLKRLLQNDAYFGGKIDGDIWYCYGIYNSQMEEMLKICPKIKFYEGCMKGWENPRDIVNPSKRNLLICDDLGDITQNSPEFTMLLTKGTHHGNIGLLSLEHHLFTDSKQRRLQSAQYVTYTLFASKRTESQIVNLAKQTSLDSGLVKFAYRDACSVQYQPLIMDFRPTTPQELMLVTNIFCGRGEPCWVYME